MIYQGACHCDRLKASFETEKTPAELGVRTCQCVFCRRHGAINISNPSGEIVIDAATNDINRYRFALNTADFLICRHCGAYIAAAMGEGERIVSTINVAGLRIMEFLNIQEAPIDYDEESLDQRVARRFKKWTPTRFADEELSLSLFGPHAA